MKSCRKQSQRALPWHNNSWASWSLHLSISLHLNLIGVAFGKLFVARCMTARAPISQPNSRWQIIGAVMRENDIRVYKQSGADQQYRFQMANLCSTDFVIIFLGKAAVCLCWRCYCPWKNINNEVELEIISIFLNVNDKD